MLPRPCRPCRALPVEVVSEEPLLRPPLQPKPEALQERIQRSAELRQAHLESIQQRARQESIKVTEVQFIQQLGRETKKQALQASRAPGPPVLLTTTRSP